MSFYSTIFCSVQRMSIENVKPYIFPKVSKTNPGKYGWALTFSSIYSWSCVSLLMHVRWIFIYVCFGWINLHSLTVALSDQDTVIRYKNGNNPFNLDILYSFPYTFQLISPSLDWSKIIGYKSEQTDT